jgi:glutamyl-tRNA synthetase
LKKRGIRPKALKDALLDLGMSQAGISFSVDWLYAKNKELIDNISHRYFFVDSPVKLIIKDVPEKKIRAEPLLMPSDPEKGTRIITSSVDEGSLILYISYRDAKNLKKQIIFRLKDLMNIEITQINLDQNFIYASFHSHELNREYSIIHWVPEEKHVLVNVLQPNGELSKGYGEIGLKKIQMNIPIQFERYGFVNPIKIENNELYCYFTH